MIFASGAAMGGPIGGLLVDSIGWRWYVFFLLVTFRIFMNFRELRQILTLTNLT